MQNTSVETLPDDWYYRPDIYALECEQLFRKHWWLLGPADQLAEKGSYLATTLMKWPLLLVRDQQNQLQGFYNICRHRAGPLVDDGKGSCREFVCRYHGWRYACSGELLKTPGMDKDEVKRIETIGLLPIRVDCWNGLLFVCLDDSAVELDEWLGDVIEIANSFPSVASMQFSGDVSREGKLNWKTYADNSCEGYHVGMVHRALGSSMARESIKVGGYDNGGFVGFDVSYSSGGKDNSRAGKGFWIYKFPGLLLHFADFTFNAETVVPVAENKIQLQRWFWADEAMAQQNGVDLASIVPSSAQVIDEDIDICEKVQRNLSSGVYPGGLLSATKEPGTIYFQQQVRDALSSSLLNECEKPVQPIPAR